MTTPNEPERDALTVVRDALAAAFEQRPGALVLVSQAVRALPQLEAALATPAAPPADAEHGDVLVAELRSALDHIAKTARKSRTSTRRLRWIEQRASTAFEGKPYNREDFDLPKDADTEFKRIAKENIKLRAATNPAAAQAAPNAGEEIDLVALIKKHSIQAHGHGTATDVLCFARELQSLLTTPPTSAAQGDPEWFKSEIIEAGNKGYAQGLIDGARPTGQASAGQEAEPIPRTPSAFIEHTNSAEDGPHQGLVWHKDSNAEFEGPVYEYTPLYRIESLGLESHDTDAIVKALKGKSVNIGSTPYEGIDQAIAWVMGVGVGKALSSKPATASNAGDALDAEIARLNAIINTPHADDFIKAVSIEAEHQRQRWGESGDAGKAPADWFWLVGYLAGKALSAHIAGNSDKAEHHIITTAAACANWHRAVFGKTDMRPGTDAARLADGGKP